MIKKIYLHWTAGRYNQIFNDYHISIDGNGAVYCEGGLTKVKAHTWHRNTDAVGIALNCCYNAKIQVANNDYIINWGDYPPTQKQIKTLAVTVALLVKAFGLSLDKDVLTHAEAAELDSYGINGTDPDMRWDLLRLPNVANISGGDYIRQLAGKELEQWN